MSPPQPGKDELLAGKSELQAHAARIMREASETTRVLMREGLIAAPPVP